MVKTKKYLASVQRNKSMKRNKRNKKSLRRNKKSLRGGKSIRRNKKSLRGGKSIRHKRRQLKKNKIQTGGSTITQSGKVYAVPLAESGITISTEVKTHDPSSLVTDGKVGRDKFPSWVVTDERTKNPINLNLIKIREPQTELADLPELPEEYSLEVLISSIGYEIMNGSSDPNVVGRMVVLPSQLNGAEYMNKSDGNAAATTKDWQKWYRKDPTGGPRGQLTGSLEVAEKIVLEASNYENEEGINYIRGLEFPSQIFLKNGYLQINPNIDETLAKKFRESLKDMSCLVSEGNIPTGFNTLANLSTAKRLPIRGKSLNKVDMVYASACPLNCVRPCTSGNYQLPEYRITSSTLEQKKIANSVLFRQYLIALTQACQFVKERELPEGQFYEVLCMPLGGGAFGNNQLDITKQYNRAIKTVEKYEEYKKLRIKMLFYDEGKDLAEFAKFGAIQYFTPNNPVHNITSGGRIMDDKDIYSYLLYFRETNKKLTLLYKSTNTPKAGTVSTLYFKAVRDKIVEAKKSWWVETQVREILKRNGSAPWNPVHP